jgi:acylphosphatase
MPDTGGGVSRAEFSLKLPFSEARGTGRGGKFAFILTRGFVAFRIMSSDVFHKDVWFDGHVQGVGFRAQVLRAARGYEVRGNVRNLDDGRVFLQVEGNEAEVGAFLAEIERNLAFFIRKVESREFWGVSCFSNFTLATGRC